MILSIVLEQCLDRDGHDVLAFGNQNLGICCHSRAEVAKAPIDLDEGGVDLPGRGSTTRRADWRVRQACYLRDRSIKLLTGECINVNANLLPRPTRSTIDSGTLTLTIIGESGSKTQKMR